MTSIISKENKSNETKVFDNDEKTHLLSDYLKRNSCYSCITKNCKNKNCNGKPFPSQFSTYVKFPMNIDEIKKAIRDAKLDNEFEGKKPFYVVCRNIHRECSNCNELRLKFIDNNRIVLCYGKTYPNNDTITVGIHIDLKLVITNNTRFKVVPLFIHIDGEKLIENYCMRNEAKNNFISVENQEKQYEEHLVQKEEQKDISTIVVIEHSDSIIEDKINDSINEDKINDSINESIKEIDNQNNDIKTDKKDIIEDRLTESNIERYDSLNEIYQSKNYISITIDEQNSDIVEHNSPFNMDDFPTLSPTPTKSLLNPFRSITPVQSSMNFNKIKEQNIDRMNKIKAKEEEAKIKMENEKKYINEFTTKITNELLDKENCDLKKENIRLNDKVKQYEQQVKSFNHKFELLTEFHKNTNTREYLNKWINNMYTMKNAVLDELNRTQYKDVEFVKNIYDNSY